MKPKKAVNQQIARKMTEAEVAVAQKNVADFNVALNELLEKHSLSIIGVPHFNQMENGLFAVSSTIQAVPVPKKLAKG